jgi:hypothetical protein
VRDFARVTAVLCALLTMPGRAAAQAAEPGSAITVSYTSLQSAQSDVFTFPVGWLVSVGGTVNRGVSSIFEAGANYRARSRGALQVYWLQGGVRFSPARRHGAAPFGQVVAGLAAVRCCGDINLGFVFEPGGGVDIAISRRSSVQIAAGLPIALAEGGSARLLRLKAGVSLTLGK